MKLIQVIEDCVTGVDGVTVDPSRVYLCLAVFVYLIGSIVSIFHTGTINYQEFGIGFGAVLAGGGFGIAAKANTEPKAVVKAPEA